MKFENYHPAINFIFFAFVFVTSSCFDNPIFLFVGYFSSFVYSVKLGKMKALKINLIYIPFIFFYALWYSYYNHFGVTVLTHNFIDNSITLEAVIYGGVIGVKTACVLMWFSCFLKIFTTDKIIYLFAKISPKLSLILSIFLRCFEKIKKQFKRIDVSQAAIGRGLSHGNIFVRIKSFFRHLSIIITWASENFIESSNSMRSRGYTLKCRSAYSLYRFDMRDRFFVIFMFVCITVCVAAVLFDQTNILYNPEIVMNRLTPLSFLFYAVYAAVCLAPCIIEIISYLRFESLRNKAFEIRA